LNGRGHRPNLERKIQLSNLILLKLQGSLMIQEKLMAMGMKFTLSVSLV
jgi:hypothetical protein